MSDLFEVENRVEKGSEWRGYITVKGHELCHRNLNNEEFSEVVNEMGDEKFNQLQEELGGGSDDEDGDDDSLDKDDAMRLRKLQKKREERGLSSDEEDELDELMDKIESSGLNPFIMLDPDIVSAMTLSAEMGIVGDEDDARELIGMRPSEQRDRVGETVTELEDAQEIVDEHVKSFLRKDTEHLAFEAGLEVLMSSLGGEGNSENSANQNEDNSTTTT